MMIATSHTQSQSTEHITLWSVMFVIICVFGLYFLLPQIGEFRQSLSILASADAWPVGAAILLVLLDMPYQAYMQVVAAGGHGRIKEVFYRQQAGIFFNHFLPLSVGVVTAMIEYYHDILGSRAKAFVVAYAPVALNVILSLVLLAIISPITLSRMSTTINVGVALSWVIPLLILLLLSGIVSAVIYWNRVKRAMNQFVEGLQILADFRLSLHLVSLCLFEIVLNGFILWLCAASVHAPLSLMTAIVLYIASLFVGDIVPTPGGIGVTEATLAVGLASSGVALPQGIAVILVFRFVTFWLPLIPELMAMQRLGKSFQPRFSFKLGRT